MLMRGNVKFNLLLSLLTIIVMAALGLIIDVARFFVYNYQQYITEYFTFTISMTLIGFVISATQVIKFYLSKRER